MSGITKPFSGVLTTGTSKIGTIELSDSAAAEILGKLEASPTTYSLGDRLKSIVTAVGALGYDFTINGVNFNGYANIKSLTLDTGAYNDHPYTLHDAGIDYEVGATHIFVAYQVTAWNQQIAMLGRIGESDTADNVITKEILKLGNGTLLPFMESCIGVFTAGKFVTAESDSGSSNYCLKSGTVLYGVEIDIS